MSKTAANEAPGPRGHCDRTTTGGRYRAKVKMANPISTTAVWWGERSIDATEGKPYKSVRLRDGGEPVSRRIQSWRQAAQFSVEIAHKCGSFR